MANLSPEFERNKFFINQKRLSFKEKYYVYDEQGNELCYVERPFGFFGRRNIGIFRDDSKREALLFINQDHYWEIFQRNYTVTDADHQTLARLSRNNIASLFLRGWKIMSPNGSYIAKAREDSVVLAIIRRVVDLIPYVDLVGGLIKTDFHLLAVDSFGNDQKIGSFNRRFSIADKYVLDLSEDREQKLDRRVGVAVGVLLDMAEKR